MYTNVYLTVINKTWLTKLVHNILTTLGHKEDLNYCDIINLDLVSFISKFSKKQFISKITSGIKFTN